MREMEVIYPVIVIIITLLTLFLIGDGVYVGFKTAPFCPTPRRAIRRALLEAGLKSGEIFYDLGAGDGRTLIIASKEFGAEARGFELSLFRFLVAKIKIIFLNWGNKDIYLHWKNLYKQDLRDADVVFVWLTPPSHRKLEEKFSHELRPGTRVITHSSPLGFWEPYRVIEPFPSGFWEEKEGNIFLYRKPREVWQA